MRTMSKQNIDGKSYEVGHWPIDKQLDIMVELIGIFGEPLANFIMGADNKKDAKTVESLMDQEVNGKALASAMSGLASRLKEANVKHLLREVTSDLLCDGKKVEFNTHFMGRVGHLMKVALFCIRHQYSDFLDVLPVLKTAGSLATDLST